MAGGATAPPPQSPGAPPSSATTPAPGGAPGGDLMAQLQAHGASVGAGAPLDRPTERPDEPVTHGLPVGPGGGPQVLNGIGGAAREGAVEQGTLTNLLQHLSTQPGATSAIQDLASRAMGGAV